MFIYDKVSHLLLIKTRFVSVQITPKEYVLGAFVFRNVYSQNI